MQIAKNAYLLAISVANSSKQQFYARDLPELHDQYQIIWTLLAQHFAGILIHSCQTFDEHVTFWQAANQRMLSSVKTVDPVIDQNIYIDFNKRSFFPPADQQFEPCAFWHDTPSLILDGDGKPFLQSVLANRQRQLESTSQVDQKFQEVEKAKDTLATYSGTTEMAESMFETYRQACIMRIDLEACESEHSVCSEALQGDVGAQALHDFKPSSFAKPAQCVVCEQNIWGMSKSTGMSCRACHVACHPKCEIKVLADCTKGKPRGMGGNLPVSTKSAKRLSIASLGSIGSGRKVPPAVPSRVPATSSSPLPNLGMATIIYDFEPQSAFEIAVQKGAQVQILAPDDNGWTKVAAGLVKGLVPSSYLSMVETSSATVPIVADYNAADESQLSVQTGEQVTIVDGDQNGWTRAQNGQGEEGFIPSWAVGS